MTMPAGKARRCWLFRRYPQGLAPPTVRPGGLITRTLPGPAEGSALREGRSPGPRKGELLFVAKSVDGIEACGFPGGVDPEEETDRDRDDPAHEDRPEGGARGNRRQNVGEQ